MQRNCHFDSEQKHGTGGEQCVATCSITVSMLFELHVIREGMDLAVFRPLQCAEAKHNVGISNHSSGFATCAARAAKLIYSVRLFILTALSH